MSYNNTEFINYQQNYYNISDGSTIGDETNFWSNSPRSEPPSSPTIIHPITSFNYHQNYPDYSADQRHVLQRLDYQNPIKDGQDEQMMVHHPPIPYVRMVKRRTTANKKERRRTQSINNAYADLRDCIPNVPPDTKLSKIKTLRLATSYINYLVKALENDVPTVNFTAELGNLTRKSHNRLQKNMEKNEENFDDVNNKMRKGKGRTGWPQHVWALELEQDQVI